MSRNLLSHGIDVYTTVNIQHIESLNDVIAQITGIRVRETVPDSIFDRADAIELVDVTPDDLIQRLKEGKVYVPQQAERALAHFFSPTNLTALRELALRRTAERVDEQLLTQMQAHAISGPWAAGERILVCISEDPRAAPAWCAMPSALPTGCMRPSSRCRSRRGAPRNSPRRSATGSPTRCGWPRRSAAKRPPFRAAPGASPTTSSLRPRQQRHPDHHRQIDPLALVRDRQRLGRARSGARRGNISVHVIAGERRLPATPIPKKTVAPPSARSRFDLAPYRGRARRGRRRAAVSALIEPWLGVENVDLVFLTAIVGVAVRYGLFPSLFASVVASLCYNFFFLPPIYTFTITDPTNVAAFVFFIIIAVLVSNVAARVRTQAVTAMARVRTTEALYAFSRKLAGVAHARRRAVGDHLPDRPDAEGAGRDAAAGQAARIAVKAGYPPEDTLGDADVAAANWAWENDRSAGRGSDTLPGAKRLFLPMRTGRGTIGIIGIDSDKPGPLLTPDQRRLLDALIDQGALAIERVHLVEDMDRVEAHRRDRPPALRAADLDLPRPQDAARRHPRRRRHVARSLRRR